MTADAQLQNLALKFDRLQHQYQQLFDRISALEAKAKENVCHPNSTQQ